MGKKAKFGTSFHSCFHILLHKSNAVASTEILYLKHGTNIYCGSDCYDCSTSDWVRLNSNGHNRKDLK